MDKLKFLFLVLFLSCIILNCSKNKVNKGIYGKWKSVNSINIVSLVFFKDTLIINQWGKEIKNEWYGDEDKISFKQLNHINPKKETNFIIHYKLNETRDTLYIKREKDSTYSNQFIKL
ncbi:hypothetical protein N1F78_14275 [Seonamhaeicola sp. MEBiC1930]|uniref:hypothetical protein n=1 Tax=Seonamhaeicola sp. MEBiC01930 TaxID=2976768 RepID=UPI0032518E07